MEHEEPVHPVANGPARERLLHAAIDLFDKKGYAATTVREIVEAAGVSKPVLYYYYGNKEGIYLEIMKQAVAFLRNRLDELRKAPLNAGERLRRLCCDLFSLMTENIKVVRLIYAIFYGPPQGAPIFDLTVFHATFHDAIKEIIQEGIQRGEFRQRSVEDMALAVHGACNVAMEWQLGRNEIALKPDDLTRVLDVIFQGISEKAGNTHQKSAPETGK